MSTTPPTRTEIMNVFMILAMQNQYNSQVNGSGVNGGNHGNNGYLQMPTYSLSYSGPYHPDQLAQMYNMSAELQHPDASDYNVTEQTWSTNSYLSVWLTSHSLQRLSLLDSNFFSSYGGMFWNTTHQQHYQGAAAASFVHLPILLPDKSSTDYLQTLQYNDTELLFNAYLHLPMPPPALDDLLKNALGSLPPHLPMLSHK
ncbi:uncharacterized protein PHACADRAFT_201303 [Phanerochaete carnosa HHB-10118-sp]|uniref:Uncharacterized protein n=1 Tax=Phanerochaete carnosa (strain HHB-10118-sp) TaxID=650164 RepID=K5WH94_PHACS|nr:uncharacterized protein PHACADRAFT_201303 [Phanerochaete carnosa HHB-10118-sp]EKM49592.1 hypothetical protein PHACADRAFT_201303 [Phanerochaete carnosa HHB-10118-sp]